jgi:hypothetical protein
MDFIERWWGISLDGGNGSIELFIVARWAGGNGMHSHHICAEGAQAPLPCNQTPPKRG